MTFENIIYEKSGGVATITLNRADVRNAMTVPLREDLALAIADVKTDPSVRALLITGNGPAFSAGGDIKRMAESTQTPTENRTFVHRTVSRIVVELLNLEKPVVSAVKGPAIGAGVSLVLASDIAIAAEDAKFGVGFLRVGLAPDSLVSWLLPRIVGLQKTKQMLFTGEPIGATEAERLGIVARVVPGDRLLVEARALAEQLAAGPTQAIGLTKTVLHRALTVDAATALELECFGQALAYTTADHREAARAFLEKRPPQFEGR